MQEIITWLRSVELLACKVYLDASGRLSDDQKFSSFLSRISEEESWHYHIIGSADRYLLENGMHPTSAILIDADIKREVEAPFYELIGLLSKGKLTRQDVVDCIVKAEFSEWNYILLYVINILSGKTFVFQHVAATIEAHKQRIIEFLEDLSDELKVPDTIYNLPKVWDKKILVVEDEPFLREVLSAVLKSVASVDLSPDGKDGLQKIKNSFYDVIISDIDMPIMNGIDFYSKAVEINPHIYRKFLFVSGVITPEIRNFLMTNHLLSLEKPFNLKKLKKIVQEIIDKTL